MHESTVGSVLPVSGSTLYDDTPVTRPRAYSFIPMDVRTQDEFLNLQAKYMAEMLSTLLLKKSNRKMRMTLLN